MRRLPLLIALLLPLTLAACASRVPIALNGDGASRGLLVVDAVFTHPVYGVNQRYPAKEGTVAALPIIDDRIPGQRLGDFLVFADLEPGTYLPREFRSRTGFFSNAQRLDAYFPLNVVPERLRVPIEGGGVHYLGRLYVFDGTGQYLPRQRAFQDVYDGNREIRAWEDILDELPNNPWAAAMRKRLDLLLDLREQARNAS